MSSLEMELDNGEENLGDDILSLSTADIQARARLMDNEVVLMTHYHLNIAKGTMDPGVHSFNQ